MNGVIKILVALLALNLASCSHRTEFGRKRLFRLSNHNGIVDNQISNLVDTAALYERQYKFTERNPEPSHKYLRTFIKFYPKNRIGIFSAYSLEDIISNPAKMNPKRADIGYYRYNKKGLEIHTLFEHPQGGGFIRYQLLKSENGILLFRWKDADTIVYKKAYGLAGKYLIYTPDW